MIPTNALPNIKKPRLRYTVRRRGLRENFMLFYLFLEHLAVRAVNLHFLTIYFHFFVSSYFYIVGLTFLQFLNGKLCGFVFLYKNCLGLGLFEFLACGV